MMLRAPYCILGFAGLPLQSPIVSAAVAQLPVNPIQLDHNLLLIPERLLKLLTSALDLRFKFHDTSFLFV
jgi:hypothetical protein